MFNFLKKRKKFIDMVESQPKEKKYILDWDKITTIDHIKPLIMFIWWFLFGWSNCLSQNQVDTFKMTEIVKEYEDTQSK